MTVRKLKMGKKEFILLWCGFMPCDDLYESPSGNFFKCYAYDEPITWKTLEKCYNDIKDEAWYCKDCGLIFIDDEAEDCPECGSENITEDLPSFEELTKEYRRPNIER